MAIVSSVTGKSLTIATGFANLALKINIHIYHVDTRKKIDQCIDYDIISVQVVLPVNEMKRRFNAATEENREDLSKQILAITLKNVIKKGDFLDMLNLLDIGDCRMDIYLQSNDSVKLATTCCKYPAYIPTAV
jgi:hypothetical protein